MRYPVTIVVCLALAAAPASAAPLPDLRTVRSVVAEARFIARLHRDHRVNDTYAREMKKSALQQLRSELQVLPATSREGRLLRQALGGVQSADASLLTRIEVEFSQMVVALERHH